jgi:hypothetical protein
VSLWLTLSKELGLTGPTLGGSYWGTELGEKARYSAQHSGRDTGALGEELEGQN